MSAEFDDPCDLIVVGGGPRALFALADLESALLDEGVTHPMRITVIEPATPGAGAVWDPGQGEHLRLNVDARVVDATSPSVPLTFVDWAGGDERFPPRALTGAYLDWAFRRLSESPVLEVRHVPARVTAVHRAPAGWECTDHRGTTVSAPRVLLTTGHAGGVGLDHAALASAITGPVPGGAVVVRGAALTAFDVALDLTGARGGRWTVREDAPSGLAYVRSGAEPASIAMVCRSGEPMLPKPVEVPAHVVAAVRERTARWEPGATPDDRWWDTVAEAAVAAAGAAGVRLTREALWERLEDTAQPGAQPDARWQADVHRALGVVDADPAWWWGRAWSAGYGDVVRSLERAPRDPQTWPRWRRRAATLERWAFGPPLDTHRRLMALRDAGLLHVVRHEPADGEARVIDAFTRGPGVAEEARAWDSSAGAWVGAAVSAGASVRSTDDRDPWPALLRSGAVTVRPGERGVLTRPDGACEGSDGMVTPGLFALGRPTEDPVIGHDSLQRRLHGDSARWAAALARQHASGAAALTFDHHEEYAHG